MWYRTWKNVEIWFLSKKREPPFSPTPVCNFYHSVPLTYPEPYVYSLFSWRPSLLSHFFRVSTLSRPHSLPYQPDPTSSSHPSLIDHDLNVSVLTSLLRSWHKHRPLSTPVTTRNNLHPTLPSPPSLTSITLIYDLGTGPRVEVRTSQRWWRQSTSPGTGGSDFLRPLRWVGSLWPYGIPVSLSTTTRLRRYRVDSKTRKRTTVQNFGTVRDLSLVQVEDSSYSTDVSRSSTSPSSLSVWEPRVMTIETKINWFLCGLSFPYCSGFVRG